jgi:hypothetical protein
MTLLELKQRVDMVLSRSGNEDLEVCIPNNKHSYGSLSVTKVKSAHQGIDWDKGSFFINPVEKMVNEVIVNDENISS